MILTSAHKSFFLWVLRFRPKDLARLLTFMSEDIQSQLQDLLQKVSSLSESQLSEFALKELKKFERSFQRTYLPEVHCDWILEKLKHESPHVISAVLRYLPADRVKDILARLPQEVLSQFPPLTDSYAIQSSLADNLKNRFEKNFSHDRVYDPQAPFDFHTILHLKGEVLRLLFWELGYSEIAMGLKLLPSQTQDLVLKKLLPQDRLVVDRVLLELKHTTDARHKKAQIHIISQDSASMDTFVFEMGCFIFAKSVLAENELDIDVIAHKLSYREGTKLKNHVAKIVQQNSQSTILLYREELLRACRRVLQIYNQSHVNKGKRSAL